MEDEKSKKKRPSFEGFRKPDKNYYCMPNEWTDIMAGIDNLAELKVVEYIMRHTWGFKEYDQFKFITIDEFMHGRLKGDGVTRMDKGTGLKSDRSIKDGLKAAIEDGYLLCEPNTKAKVKKSYKLKMQKVESTHKGKDAKDVWVDTTHQEGSNYPPESQNPPTNGVDSTYHSPSGEKETERHLKETGERKDPSSDQKEKVTEYLKMYMRPFLQELGEGDMLDEDLNYLQEVYYFSELDKITFRLKAETAMKQTREAKGNIDYFYDNLCGALGIREN